MQIISTSIRKNADGAIGDQPKPLTMAARVMAAGSLMVIPREKTIRETSGSLEAPVTEDHYWQHQQRQRNTILSEGVPVAFTVSIAGESETPEVNLGERPLSC